MTLEANAVKHSAPPATDNDTDQSAAAASAAQAASQAAKPIADPQHRAAAGFDLAKKSLPAGANAATKAEADAGANARTAMERTDLPPEQAAKVRNVVERLGNALVDGKIEPHINDTFRQHLRDLATKPADSGDFKGAQAQLTRAAEVLNTAELAGGTRLAYDAGANQPTGHSGLPILDVKDIDADLYFKTADGTLHIEGVKANPGTLSNDFTESARRGPEANQTGRQTAWQSQGTTEAPRSLSVQMVDDGPGFGRLLTPQRLGQLTDIVGGDVTKRSIGIGDRAYDVRDLQSATANADAAIKAHLDTSLQQHAASGQPAETFNAKLVEGQFAETTIGSASDAMRSHGTQYGESRPTLTRLPQPELPSLRQGGAFGAAAAGGITLLSQARDGKFSFGDVAQQTAVGAGVGTVQAAGERVVTPVIDRAVGQGVQRLATSTATKVAGTMTVESAAAFGAGARTLATRIGGSTVVGAAIATGISAYENRDGLARGDSHAIGNVTADATVAVGSIAAATATGAAIGSVVPVAGTAVGAVVGLAVGVGVAYGAQISGARDAIANGVSNAVDWVKSWF